MVAWIDVAVFLGQPLSFLDIARLQAKVSANVRFSSGLGGGSECGDPLCGLKTHEVRGE